MGFTILPVFQFLAMYRNTTVGLTCHDDRMCRNEQGILVPLATKGCERVDEIGMS